MKTVVLNVEMMGKPRMTRSDVWKEREVVQRYWSLKDNLTEEARKANLHLPDEFIVRFYLPMPESWSNKKKVRMEGKPHQVKPDKDNLEKALLDCLKVQDQTVWHTDVYKYWSSKPRVEIDIED